MTNTYICTDWHLGQTGTVKYRSEFEDCYMHDLTILKRYFNTVKEGDTVYFLGDITSNRYCLDVIGQLPGTKILIMGNHDNLPAKQLLESYDDIQGPLKYKGAWLTHHPIHPQELYGMINIHGHTHDQFVMSGSGKSIDYRYYNACPEYSEYTPINIEKIFDDVRNRGVYK